MRSTYSARAALGQQAVEEIRETEENSTTITNTTNLASSNDLGHYHFRMHLFDALIPTNYILHIHDHEPPRPQPLYDLCINTYADWTLW
jgi:hypothetical protein